MSNSVLHRKHDYFSMSKCFCFECLYGVWPPEVQASATWPIYNTEQPWETAKASINI